MSTEFTINITVELKRRLEENPVDWSREVRRFREERVRRIESLRTLKEMEYRAEKRRVKVTQRS